MIEIDLSKMSHLIAWITTLFTIAAGWIFLIIGIYKSGLNYGVFVLLGLALLIFGIISLWIYTIATQEKEKHIEEEMDE